MGRVAFTVCRGEVGGESYKDIGGRVWGRLEDLVAHCEDLNQDDFAELGVYVVALPGKWEEITEEVAAKTWRRLTKRARIIGIPAETVYRKFGAGVFNPQDVGRLKLEGG